MQYIANKLVKFDVKLPLLADTKNGHTLNLTFILGREIKLRKTV